MGQERIRWGWVVGCEALGVAIIMFAFYFEDRWKWHGVAESTLVNVGTAFGFAGVLFLLERRFTRVVGRVATRAAGDVVGDVARRLEARTDMIERRLDELSEATAQRRTARTAAQDAAVGALDSISFQSVAAALRTANSIGALADDVAIVHASDDPLGLQLEFRWCRSIKGEVGLGQQRVGPALLTIAGRAPAAVDENAARRVLEVEWPMGADPADIGDRVEHKLVELGWWQGGATFDWPHAIQNLRRTLEVAIASRRKDDGAWHLGGPLYELVGDEWAITEFGLESPPHSYVLRQETFPELASFDRVGVLVRPEFNVDRPAWADDREWQHLVSEGRRRFPRHNAVAMLTSPSWIAEVDEPRE